MKKNRKIKPPSLTSADYYWYIKSDAWKEVKKRYLATKSDRRCLVCKKPYDDSFHFHHRTYRRLGCEKLTDIHPVCTPCHNKIHGR